MDQRMMARCEEQLAKLKNGIWCHKSVYIDTEVLALVWQTPRPEEVPKREHCNFFPNEGCLYYYLLGAWEGNR